MTIEQLQVFIGETARPVSIVAIGASIAYAIGVGAMQVETAEGGALYVTAVLGGFAVIYGAKSFEKGFTARQSAKVEIARAQAPAGADTAAAAIDAGEGELPLTERVTP